ncbi:glycosyltransferase family 2 protein [Microbacterium rhizosphaerae]|uniref:Glycosyltransferase family 2 protein n=1 Tax=Microbacterium rhizosphaerae TaxID=1678237 RepID=A0ABZ0SRQ9_9MICO|nr:glycosyltransferase family 2 protein [Microbacterium rhizosphaerae]WPR91125.1 glycosyltransferase family 2 protein [Microbacterium rhizosphaerae]
MSTLSVVIPSYNDAAMLRECLRALAAQTRQPDELIVVDNGCTDDTAQIARAAGARVVVEPVRGVLRATAAGFDAATGEIIGRLDADSRPNPDWIARVMADFRTDPTLDAVTGGGVFYGGRAFWRFVGRWGYLGGYVVSMRVVLGRTPLFGSNFALRREVWDDVRGRIHLDDPRTHDDLDITCVLDPDTSVDYDPGLLMPVSARPFDRFAEFQRRASWAFHGLGVNLREVPWLTRLRLTAAGRRRRRARRAAYEVSLRSVPASPE